MKYDYKFNACPVDKITEFETAFSISDWRSGKAGPTFIDAKWIGYVTLGGGGRNLAGGHWNRTTAQYADLLEGAVGMAKSRLSLPWAIVEQELWDDITSENLARLVSLGARPSAESGNWDGARKLSLLESEIKCP